jgi:hypothetical protein
LNNANHRQAKTFDRFTDAVEGSKEMIEPQGAKRLTGFRTQRCKADVAIAFDGFLQAAQQKVTCALVQPTKPGTIQHKSWPVNIDAILKLAVESLLLTCI